MAVIVEDQLDLDLDRIAAITADVEHIEDPVRRARTLRALWLGVYSMARDRGERSVAAVACLAFFFQHEVFESLTAPP